MDKPCEIILQISSINELLRSSVSSYAKRMLKSDAEEFIVEEASNLSCKSVINIKINIPLSEFKHKDELANAIHSHFYYRKVQLQKKYNSIFRYGWRKLFLALGLLAVIFSLTEIALHLIPGNKVVQFIRESFIILGWVALWRPLEMLLYDWFPVKKNLNLYNRLEQSNVEVITET